MRRDKHRSLHAAHAPHAVERRLAAPPSNSYLADAVLGAIDGCVTTMAIVAAVVGANLATGVALVLGIANLLADGFSMAVSNYQSARTRRHQVDEARRMEHHHIERVPEGEAEEIRQIYAGKGFSGELLERIVETITADRDRWVDTMLVEEHGMQLHGPEPWKSAGSTFAAFVVVGLVPLLPLAIDTLSGNRMFAASVGLSMAAFRRRCAEGPRARFTPATLRPGDAGGRAARRRCLPMALAPCCPGITWRHDRTATGRPRVLPVLLHVDLASLRLCRLCLGQPDFQHPVLAIRAYLRLVHIVGQGERACERAVKGLRPMLFFRRHFLFSIHVCLRFSACRSRQ
ncbi:MAG: VIT1/CCC1 transporter family protein [Woeseiaceae bacterium]|nr:VIT1/CCC1 transporter family protein [Woeseiaceae bacterium]